MELSASVILLLLLICKMSWAEGDIPQSDLQHSNSIQNEDYENTQTKVEGKRASVGTRDLIRMFIMAFHNNYPDGVHYDKYGGGIPFRPARRIGSEFLGKRSGNEPLYHETSEEDEGYPGSLMKRARVRMGSEFLGKRRLGSEFLGKRTSSLNYNENFLNEPEELDFPLKSSSMQSSTYLPRSYEKRALGSEFLGKRRPSNPYDWTWKRARLGSEFLGKRALGSEFLGKRTSHLNHLHSQLTFHNNN